MAEYEDDVKAKESKAKRESKISSLRSKGLSERDATIQALVSMKREESDDYPAEAGPSPNSDYPYGLCIRLENEDLDKLGLGELPAVGSVFDVTAKATVKSISSNQGLDDESPRRGVEMQITDMKASVGSGAPAPKAEAKETEEEDEE